jgi:hypothetical protein
MTADHRAQQAIVRHRATKFGGGEVGRLHRHGGNPHEPVGHGTDAPCDAGVLDARAVSQTSPDCHKARSAAPPPAAAGRSLRLSMSARRLVHVPAAAGKMLDRARQRCTSVPKSPSVCGVQARNRGRHAGSAPCVSGSMIWAWMSSVWPVTAELLLGCVSLRPSGHQGWRAARFPFSARAERSIAMVRQGCGARPARWHGAKARPCRCADTSTVSSRIGPQSWPMCRSPGG